MTTPPKRISELGWESYAWLIYSLSFIGAALIVPQYSATERVIMVVAYVVFLPLYLVAQAGRGPQLLWIAAFFDVLAFAFGEMNPGSSSFLVYASAVLAKALPMRHAMWVLAAQVIVTVIVSLMLDVPWWFLMMAVLISPLIGAVTIQAEAREVGDAKLRLAQAEVERLAKLAERERIARDLHDLLGHTLSVVVLKSELAQKLMSRDPARAMQEIAEVERISRQGLADVREAITGYRSSGLPAEIEHVRETLTAAGIDTTIEARPLTLAPAQETALSLALREAATNVIRHAAATRCHIKFYAQDGSALMEVQDDGKGGEAPFGNGLTGMRERIQSLGGALQRESERGTKLMIRLPLKVDR